MKCPYRINTIITPLSDNAKPGETQEFADCYGPECPFYIPENTRRSTPAPGEMRPGANRHIDKHRRTNQWHINRGSSPAW